jgi:hypothetical protein
LEDPEHDEAFISPGTLAVEKRRQVFEKVLGFCPGGRDFPIDNGSCPSTICRPAESTGHLPEHPRG